MGTKERMVMRIRWLMGMRTVPPSGDAVGESIDAVGGVYMVALTFETC